MKRFCLLVTATLLIATVASASDSRLARFEGTVYTKGGAIEFLIKVPVGQTTTVQMEHGLSLRLSSEDESSSKAVLLGPGGELKRSESKYPVDIRPAFAFLVCDSEVIHISPQPDVAPSCS